MCIFKSPKAPTPPPPLPPAPVPPSLPGSEPLPEEKVRPVNPQIREAQSKLGTKKGKKGSTGDLRIKRDQNVSGLDASINTGNVSNTGGIQ